MNNFSYKKLNIAPCLYYGNVLDKMVICGHSYNSHFGNLKKLSVGDVIIFTDTNLVNYLYEVVAMDVLAPTEIDEMINSEFDLTLFTCTNDGLNRVTVRCNKIIK